ncbi:MAG: hypothetical protein WCO68_07740 [Verrucomicrobiota bacterium]
MKQTLQIWLFAALLFVAALALFTRVNGFPFYYHPDEGGKVEQVQTAHWNFNHPMLMLSTARLAVLAAGVDLTNPQRVVEVGRTVSAGFAAGSVALLAALVWIVGGRFAGVAAGLLLLTHHQLFELAHYFKEDTALLFGLSAWLLAVALYSKRPHWTTAALVGAGAALAVSGKYIGVFAPVLSLFLIPHYTQPGRRGAALGVFLGAFVAAFALVNLPLLLKLATFGTSFQREMDYVVHGQRGTTRSVPHTVYLTAFRDNVHVGLCLLLLCFWRNFYAQRSHRTALGWVLFLFPILFLALLSFSPKTHDRYFLPATALFVCGAALGAGQLSARPGWRKAALVLALVAGTLQVAGLSKRDLRSYYRAFQVDDRTELTAWINAHHPAAVIAQDSRTLLPTAEEKRFLPYQPGLSARVLGKSVDKLGDLAALRAEGVTLVALCQGDFGTYNLKSLRPQSGKEEAWRKIGELYRVLRADRKPLWERPRSLVTYLHPGLMVYDLPPEAP